MNACARDPYWDVVKGLLIILMVLGHALQFAVGGNFWGDPLWMGIYLFLMPLFALGLLMFGDSGRKLWLQRSRCPIL